MFTQDELNEFVQQLLASPTPKRWDRWYATPLIVYMKDTDGEETIEIHEGNANIEPRLYWVQSLMLEGMYYTQQYGNVWNDRGIQDRVLHRVLDYSLCKTVSPDEFYEKVNVYTEGHLPLALRRFSPVKEAICMKEMTADISIAYLARTDYSYITFFWNSTA